MGLWKGVAVLKLSTTNQTCVTTIRPAFFRFEAKGDLHPSKVRSIKDELLMKDIFTLRNSLILHKDNQN